MGPNFNFYKFKGITDMYKTRCKDLQRGLLNVDQVLENQFGLKQPPREEIDHESMQEMTNFLSDVRPASIQRSE